MCFKMDKILVMFNYLRYECLKCTILVFILEGRHRKISQDLLEVWKTNIQPLYEKELEEDEKNKKRNRSDDLWIIKV